MAGRSWTVIAATALLGSALLVGAPLGAQDAYPIEARIWTDRGEEPLVRRGERVRVYYRVDTDAYVAIFQIDTDGTARLLFPRSPEENHYVRGGQDYRLLFPRSPYWSVEDYPGVGYYFIVASPRPFDFSAFRYSHYGSGWDLTRVGRAVYRDPYKAIDDFVAYLIPDWQHVPYGLDFLEYRAVDRGVDRAVAASYRYPRFLCYDCHGFRPYYVWNPYRYTCLSFRVVIFDHPYYYARTRYRGSAVVYTRPPVSSGPRFAFKERGDGEPGTPLVVASGGGVADRPGVRGAPAPRRSSGSAEGSTPAATSRPGAPGTGGRAPGRSDAGRGVAGSGERPSATPAPPRRPSSILPGRGGGGERTPPTVRVDPGSRSPSSVRRPSEGGSRATPPASSGRDRPVLQRRPSGGSGGRASPQPRAPVRRDPPARQTPPATRSRGGSGGRPSARPSRPRGSSGSGSGGGSGGSARPSRGGSSGGSAPSRRPPRRPGGGGEDGAPVTVEELASRGRDAAVAVTSLADGRPRGARSNTASRSAVTPASGERDRAGETPSTGPGRSPEPRELRSGSPARGRGAGVGGTRPSGVVRGAAPASSPPSRAGSARGGTRWIVRGAPSARAGPPRSAPAPRARVPSSSGNRAVIGRGSGAPSRGSGSGAVISRSGGNRAPAARVRGAGGSSRSSGAAQRPPRSGKGGGRGGGR